MILDLGYVTLEMPAGWMSRLDRGSGRLTFHSLHTPANATLALLSAGDDLPEEVIARLYESMEIQHRSRAAHFNDLAEEFEYEMISELPVFDNEVNCIIQHIFLRLCGDVIVALELNDYLPEDEETIRRILSSLSRSNFQQSQPELERLEFPNQLNGWDWVGNVAITMGG